MKKSFKISQKTFFDTFEILLNPSEIKGIKQRALDKKINLLYLDDRVRLSLDETVRKTDLEDLFFVLTGEKKIFLKNLESKLSYDPLLFKRKTQFLVHKTFNSYHSETEMMRYLHSLAKKDIALNQSMIALGSCTMKLNSVTEMQAITDPRWSYLHPFIESFQAKGYEIMIKELESMLKVITGFHSFSFQPNAGSQGEYAGL